MQLVDTIRIQKAKYTRLQDADLDQLEFGQYVSDHMFLCTYEQGAWNNPQVIPFQDLTVSPTALVLHYGQSVFEGMKAFRMKDGSVNIFRLQKHHERFNRSLDRMCMPAIPFELFQSALQELVRTDRDWVPGKKGSALYLRPFVFATEARFGVKVSDEYKFVIITGPVPLMYPRPIKVKVERNYIRAAKGGTGYAKCAGNYAAAFYPTQIAKNEGFDQILWTDASQHEFFEESGTMNLMFVIDGTLLTPPLSDSILDGVTRDSLLQIARDRGIPTEERPVSITELLMAFKQGTVSEVFGVGTAAVVAPISHIGIDQEIFQLPDYSENQIFQLLRQELETIRTGGKEDVYGWNHVID
ncbi:MAG: branched-chain amino acid aminotransferase [Flavisolibacter sp.]